MRTDDVRWVVHRVRSLIDVNGTELGEEFFPAHLSVALIDAIFTANRKYALVVPIVERYCQRFSLNRVRQDKTTLPSVGDQETLSDLIGHYETLGLDELQETVFRVRWPAHSSTRILRSENVRRAAERLRGLGIETLQDIQSKRPDEIKCALEPLRGIGDRTIHMLLMYVGHDDFVKGDVHVCPVCSRGSGQAEGFCQGGRAASRQCCAGTRHRPSPPGLRNLGLRARAAVATHVGHAGGSHNVGDDRSRVV